MVTKRLSLNRVAIGTLGLLCFGCGTAACAEALPQVQTRGGAAVVRLPAGDFTMGAANGPANESPPHKVALSAFYLDQAPVTQAEYERLMGNNPSRVKVAGNPVETVRWSDAARYCNARSKEEGLEPCYDPETWVCDFSKGGYRLPTEAEWEYACRAGTTTAFFCGDNAGVLQIYAWHAGNSGKRPHPVGARKPNAWGLLDMAGNVYQWCQDYYDPDYYRRGPAANPTGPATGEFKVLRGGSFRSETANCRSAARHKDSPGFLDSCVGYDAYGFRCARRAAD